MQNEAQDRIIAMILAQVRAIAHTHPDKVDVVAKFSNGSIQVEVRPHCPEDTGRILGTGGSVVELMRRMLVAASTRRHQVKVTILQPGQPFNLTGIVLSSAIPMPVQAIAPEPQSADPATQPDAPKPAKAVQLGLFDWEKVILPIESLMYFSDPVREILEVLSVVTNTPIPTLISRAKHKSLADKRMVGMRIAALWTNLSLKEIGDRFGDRDHGTVIHARNQIREEIDEHRPVLEKCLSLLAKRSHAAKAAHELEVQRRM